MRRMLTVAGGALLLAACGGSDGGSSPVSVVTGSTPTPTPTPTATPIPTPTPTPTPTPLPTSSSPKFTSLTGDQTFQTACASLVLGSGLPTPGPSLPYGQALKLVYSGSAASWTISGDAVSQVFTASDVVSAPSGQTSYQHAGATAPQVFTITAPAPSGLTLNYTRSLSLRADKSSGTTLYSCAFGVSSILADIPTAAVSFGKVAVSGTAYVADQNGVVQTYQLASAATTTSYDPSTRLVSVRMHLIGYLQTGTTVATTSTELGTYSGTASVGAGQSIFSSGSLDGVDRVSLFSSFSGAFFGGIELGSAFEIKATDTSTNNTIVVVGTFTAAQ